MDHRQHAMFGGLAQRFEERCVVDLQDPLYARKTLKLVTPSLISDGNFFQRIGAQVGDGEVKTVVDGSLALGFGVPGRRAPVSACRPAIGSQSRYGLLCRQRQPPDDQ